jgi:hypothetical protein
MLLSSPTLAQERSQARSMVISQYGIVAAEHPLAARACTAMLEAGGNAIDAAVAANAAMGLTAPMMAGPGGDLFGFLDGRHAHHRKARTNRHRPGRPDRRGTRKNHHTNGRHLDEFILLVRHDQFRKLYDLFVH